MGNNPDAGIKLLDELSRRMNMPLDEILKQIIMFNRADAISHIFISMLLLLASFTVIMVMHIKYGPRKIKLNDDNLELFILIPYFGAVVCFILSIVMLIENVGLLIEWTYKGESAAINYLFSVTVKQLSTY